MGFPSEFKSSVSSPLTDFQTPPPSKPSYEHIPITELEYDQMKEENGNFPMGGLSLKQWVTGDLKQHRVSSEKLYPLCCQIKIRINQGLFICHTCWNVVDVKTQNKLGPVEEADIIYYHFYGKILKPETPLEPEAKIGLLNNEGYCWSRLCQTIKLHDTPEISPYACPPGAEQGESTALFMLGMPHYRKPTKPVVENGKIQRVVTYVSEADRMRMLPTFAKLLHNPGPLLNAKDFIKLMGHSKVAVLFMEIVDVNAIHFHGGCNSYCGFIQPPINNKWYDERFNMKTIPQMNIRYLVNRDDTFRFFTNCQKAFDSVLNKLNNRIEPIIIQDEPQTENSLNSNTTQLTINTCTDLIIYKPNPAIMIGINVNEFVKKLDGVLLTSVDENVRNNASFSNELHNHDTKALKTMLQSTTKKQVFLTNDMKAESLEHLQQQFPNWLIHNATGRHHSHPYHAASRVLHETNIYELLGSNLPIFDLGGNYARHFKRNRWNVHSCFKKTNILEQARYTNMNLSLHKAACKNYNTIMQKLFSKVHTTKEEITLLDKLKELSEGTTNLFCFNDAVDCPLVSKQPVCLGMSIDSIFDVNPFEILEWHSKKNIIKSRHAMTFSYDYMYKKQGHLDFHEGKWWIEQGLLKLTFNGVDEILINSFDNIMKYISKKLFIANRGGIYIRIEGKQAAHLIIDIYSVSEKQIMNIFFKKAVWFTESITESIYCIPIIDKNLPGKLLNQLAHKYLPFDKSPLHGRSEEDANLFKHYEHLKPDSHIFSFKYVLINQEIKHLLMVRLMSSLQDTTKSKLEKLTEYSTGLGFMTLIGSSSISKRFKEDPETLYHHILVCLYEHNQIDQALLPILMLVTNKNEHNWVDKMKECVNNFLNQILNMFDITDIDIIKEFVDTYSSGTMEKFGELNSDHISGLQNLFEETSKSGNVAIVNCNPEYNKLKTCPVITNQKNLFKKFNDKYDFSDSELKPVERCKHKCDHPCIPSLHFKFIDSNEIGECDCCGISSYLRFNICANCTDRKCHPHKKCPHKHFGLSMHCCGQEFCDHKQTEECGCCLIMSSTDPCLECVDEETEPENSNLTLNLGEPSTNIVPTQIKPQLQPPPTLSFSVSKDYNKLPNKSSMKGKEPETNNTNSEDLLYKYSSLGKFSALEPKTGSFEPIDVPKNDSISNPLTDKDFEDLSNLINTTIDDPFPKAINTVTTTKQIVTIPNPEKGKIYKKNLNNRFFDGENEVRFTYATMLNIFFKPWNAKYTDEDWKIINLPFLFDQGLQTVNKPQNVPTITYINYLVRHFYNRMATFNLIKKTTDIEKKNTLRLKLFSLYVGNNKEVLKKITNVVKTIKTNTKSHQIPETSEPSNIGEGEKSVDPENIQTTITTTQEETTTIIEEPTTSTSWAEEMDIIDEQLPAQPVRTPNIPPTITEHVPSTSLVHSMIEENPVIRKTSLNRPPLLIEQNLPNFPRILIKQIAIYETFENQGNGQCGWYAIQQLFKLNMNSNLMLRQFTNSSEWYRGSELGNWCAFNGFNLIVIDNYDITAYRGSSSNKFGTIMSSELIDDRKHWIAVNAKVLLINDVSIQKTLFSNNFVTVYNDLLKENKTIDELLTNKIDPLKFDKVMKKITSQDEDHYEIQTYLKYNTYLQEINNHYEGTIPSFKQTNLKHYVKSLPNKVKIIHAPCSFGKTTGILNLIPSNKSITLIMPLRKAVDDIYSYYTERNIRTSKRHSGVSTSNFNDDNKPQVLVTTVDSFMYYTQTHKSKLPTEYYLLDEMHEFTANYVLILNYLLRHVDHDKIMISSATLIPELLVNEMRHPIKVHEFKTKEEIPDLATIIHGKTFIIHATVNDTKVALENHKNHPQLKNLQATIINSDILRKTPNIVNDPMYKVFYCTNCVGVGSNIPDIDTLIDYGERLRINYSVSDVLDINSFKKMISINYVQHSWNEKIQMQRRVGRTKPGNYYGVLQFSEIEYVFQELINLINYNNKSLPIMYSYVLEQIRHYDFKNNDLRNLQTIQLEERVKKINLLEEKTEYDNRQINMLKNNLNTLDQEIKAVTNVYNEIYDMMNNNTEMNVILTKCYENKILSSQANNLINSLPLADSQKKYKLFNQFKQEFTKLYNKVQDNADEESMRVINQKEHIINAINDLHQNILDYQTEITELDDDKNILDEATLEKMMDKWNQLIECANQLKYFEKTIGTIKHDPHFTTQNQALNHFIKFGNLTKFDYDQNMGNNKILTLFTNQKILADYLIKCRNVKCNNTILSFLDDKYCFHCDKTHLPFAMIMKDYPLFSLVTATTPLINVFNPLINQQQYMEQVYVDLTQRNDLTITKQLLQNNVIELNNYFYQMSNYEYQTLPDTISYLSDFILINFNSINYQWDLLISKFEIHMYETFVCYTNKKTKYFLTYTYQTDFTIHTDVEAILLPKTKLYFKKFLILHLLSHHIPFNNVRTKINQATVINGVAGSGKTSNIIKDNRDNLVIISQTHVRESLKKKLKQAMILSPLLLMFHYDKTFDQIYWDECNTVSNKTLLSLMPSGNDRYLLGDTYQLSCEVDDENFIDYDITYFKGFMHHKDYKETKRFGDSVCAVLRELDYDIYSKKKQDTDINVILYNKELTSDFLIPYIENSNNPVHKILCVSNTLKQKINDWYKINICETIGKYEGDQADHILVIFDHIDKYTINPQFTYTAFTRCIKSLTVCFNTDILKHEYFNKVYTSIMKFKVNTQQGSLISDIINKMDLLSYPLLITNKGTNITISYINKEIKGFHQRFIEWVNNIIKQLTNYMTKSFTEIKNKFDKKMRNLTEKTNCIIEDLYELEEGDLSIFTELDQQLGDLSTHQILENFKLTYVKIKTMLSQALNKGNCFMKWSLGELRQHLTAYTTELKILNRILNFNKQITLYNKGMNADLTSAYHNLISPIDLNIVTTELRNLMIKFILIYNGHNFNPLDYQLIVEPHSLKLSDNINTLSLDNTIIEAKPMLLTSENVSSMDIQSIPLTVPTLIITLYNKLEIFSVVCANFIKQQFQQLKNYFHFNTNPKIKKFIQGAEIVKKYEETPTHVNKLNEIWDKDQLDFIMNPPKSGTNFKLMLREYWSMFTLDLFMRVVKQFNVDIKNKNIDTSESQELMDILANISSRKKLTIFTKDTIAQVCYLAEKHLSIFTSEPKILNKKTTTSLIKFLRENNYLSGDGEKITFNINDSLSLREIIQNISIKIKTFKLSITNDLHPASWDKVYHKQLNTLNLRTLLKCLWTSIKSSYHFAKNSIQNIYHKIQNKYNEVYYNSQLNLLITSIITLEHNYDIENPNLNVGKIYHNLLEKFGVLIAKLINKNVNIDMSILKAKPTLIRDSAEHIQSLVNNPSNLTKLYYITDELNINIPHNVLTTDLLYDRILKISLMYKYGYLKPNQIIKINSYQYITASSNCSSIIKTLTEIEPEQDYLTYEYLNRYMLDENYTGLNTCKGTTNLSNLNCSNAINWFKLKLCNLINWIKRLWHNIFSFRKLDQSHIEGLEEDEELKEYCILNQLSNVNDKSIIIASDNNKVNIYEENYIDENHDSVINLNKYPGTDLVESIVYTGQNLNAKRQSFLSKLKIRTKNIAHMLNIYGVKPDETPYKLVTDFIHPIAKEAKDYLIMFQTQMLTNEYSDNDRTKLFTLVTMLAIEDLTEAEAYNVLRQIRLLQADLETRMGELISIKDLVIKIHNWMTEQFNKTLELANKTQNSYQKFLDNNSTTYYSKDGEPITHCLFTFNEVNSPLIDLTTDNKLKSKYPLLDSICNWLITNFNILSNTSIIKSSLNLINKLFKKLKLMGAYGTGIVGLFLSGVLKSTPTTINYNVQEFPKIETLIKQNPSLKDLQNIVIDTPNLKEPNNEVYLQEIKSSNIPFIKALTNIKAGLDYETWKKFMYNELLTNCIQRKFSLKQIEANCYRTEGKIWGIKFSLDTYLLNNQVCHTVRDNKYHMWFIQEQDKLLIYSNDNSAITTAATMATANKLLSVDEVKDKVQQLDQNIADNLKQLNIINSTKGDGMSTSYSAILINIIKNILDFIKDYLTEKYYKLQAILHSKYLCSEQMTVSTTVHANTVLDLTKDTTYIKYQSLNKIILNDDSNYLFIKCKEGVTSSVAEITVDAYTLLESHHLLGKFRQLISYHQHKLINYVPPTNKPFINEILSGGDLKPLNVYEEESFEVLFKYHKNSYKVISGGKKIQFIMNGPSGCGKTSALNWINENLISNYKFDKILPTILIHQNLNNKTINLVKLETYLELYPNIFDINEFNSLIQEFGVNNRFQTDYSGGELHRLLACVYLSIKTETLLLLDEVDFQMGQKYMPILLKHLHRLDRHYILVSHVTKGHNFNEIVTWEMDKSSMEPYLINKQNESNNQVCYCTINEQINKLKELLLIKKKDRPFILKSYTNKWADNLPTDSNLTFTNVIKILSKLKPTLILKSKLTDTVDNVLFRFLMFDKLEKTAQGYYESLKKLINGMSDYTEDDVSKYKFKFEQLMQYKEYTKYLKRTFSHDQLLFLSLSQTNLDVLNTSKDELNILINNINHDQEFKLPLVKNYDACSKCFINIFPLLKIQPVHYIPVSNQVNKYINLVNYNIGIENPESRFYIDNVLKYDFIYGDSGVGKSTLFNTLSEMKQLPLLQQQRPNLDITIQELQDGLVASYCLHYEQIPILTKLHPYWDFKRQLSIMALSGGEYSALMIYTLNRFQIKHCLLDETLRSLDEDKRDLYINSPPALNWHVIHHEKDKLPINNTLLLRTTKLIYQVKQHDSYFDKTMYIDMNRMADSLKPLFRKYLFKNAKNELQSNLLIFYVGVETRRLMKLNTLYNLNKQSSEITAINASELVFDISKGYEQAVLLSKEGLLSFIQEFSNKHTPFYEVYNNNKLITSINIQFPLELMKIIPFSDLNIMIDHQNRTLKTPVNIISNLPETQSIINIITPSIKLLNKKIGKKIPPLADSIYDNDIYIMSSMLSRKNITLTYCYSKEGQTTPMLSAFGKKNFRTITIGHNDPCNSCHIIFYSSNEIYFSLITDKLNFDQSYKTLLPIQKFDFPTMKLNSTNQTIDSIMFKFINPPSILIDDPKGRTPFKQIINRWVRQFHTKSKHEVNEQFINNKEKIRLSTLRSSKEKKMNYIHEIKTIHNDEFLNDYHKVEWIGNSPPPYKLTTLNCLEPKILLKMIHEWNVKVQGKISKHPDYQELYELDHQVYLGQNFTTDKLKPNINNCILVDKLSKTDVTLVHFETIMKFIKKNKMTNKYELKLDNLIPNNSDKITLSNKFDPNLSFETNIIQSVTDVCHKLNMNVYIFLSLADLTSDFLIPLLQTNFKTNYNPCNDIIDKSFYLNTDQLDDIEYDIDAKPHRLFSGPLTHGIRQLGFINAEPHFTRPAPLKSYNTIAKAINRKINQEKKLRKHKHSFDTQLKYFAKAYFINDWENLIKLYQNNHITFDEDICQEWLNGRDSKKIMKEFDELSVQKPAFYKINKVRIIEKSESITKGDTYSNIKEMLNRVVLWNPYGYNILFAPIYSMAKYRFKKLLRTEVIYAEDMNMQEMNKYLNKINLKGKKNKRYTWFESDLSKQDRQTDQHSLDFEYKLYELLGVDIDINNFYKQQHVNTILKSKDFKSRTSPKRHTGQTTVGFGNIINNWRTYAKFFSETEFLVIMGLGDDLLAKIECGFNAKILSKYVEDYHNMESTYSAHPSGGIFCQMLVYELNDTVIVCPNLVRLEDRFRSLHTIDDNILDIIKSKTISYCWMIGNNYETAMICDNLMVPRPWTALYNKTTMFIINSIHHGIGINDVIFVYNNLISSMNNGCVKTIKFKIVSNQKEKQKRENAKNKQRQNNV